MEYKKYIKLGFKRHDLDDQVEFNQTGYKGFSLEKIISDKLSICVTSGNLDKPKLYIKRRGKDTYHIINITGEMILDVIDKMLACFYGNYRDFIKNKGNFNETKLNFHLDKFGDRYSIITESISTPKNTLIRFSVRRKKGLKKYIYSKIYDAQDFI